MRNPTSRRPSNWPWTRWRRIAPPRSSLDLEVYPIDLPDTRQLVEQLKAAVPDVQATMDTTLGRLLVFASPEDQATVKEMIQKLGRDVDAETRQVVVYQPKHFDPTALTTLINNWPRVPTSPPTRNCGGSWSVRRHRQQTMIKSLVDQLDSGIGIGRQAAAADLRPWRSQLMPHWSRRCRDASRRHRYAQHRWPAADRSWRASLTRRWSRKWSTSGSKRPACSRSRS